MTGRVAVHGIGVVGGFGCGLEALRQALTAGEVRPQLAPVATPEGTQERPAYLADTSRLEEFVAKRALRRIDHFSRLALLGAHLALQDAGRLESDRSRLGVVIATGYGALRTTFAFLDSFIEDGDGCSSPTHFSSSVHNAAAANISILLEASGPSLTVSQFEMSVPSALLTAAQWLEEGRVDAVLFGGVDEYCEVLGYCWYRFFGGGSGAVRPLDLERQSAIPGEGAAFFLLTRDAGAQPQYGYLAGVHQGNVGGGLPPLPPGVRLLLGADGHEGCGSLYRQHLPAGVPAASFAPLYGSLPIAPAFDLAVAGLCIREKRIFTAPAGALGPAGSFAGDLGSTPLGCLKFGRGGDYGLLTLERG